MASYANLLTGLNVGTASAVDKRLILTKNEMLNLRFEDTGIKFKIPTHTLDKSIKTYFCICKEDKKLYIYNEDIAASETTGNFHAIDDCIELKVDGGVIE